MLALSLLRVAILLPVLRVEIPTESLRLDLMYLQKCFWFLSLGSEIRLLVYFQWASWILPRTLFPKVAEFIPAPFSIVSFR